MVYHILDIFFVILHSSLIFFNLSGWIFRKTMRWNLVTLILTGSSWLFLGLLTGVPGYCPFTDWHFAILDKMGKSDLPSSYIKYLADRLTGLDLNSSLVDTVTLLTFITALLLSLILNIKDYILNTTRN